MKYIKCSYNTGYVRNDKTFRIYHFIRLYKRRVKLPGNVYVPEELWSEKLGKAVGKSKKVRDINFLLEKERSQLNEILIRYRLSGRELSPERLKKEFANPEIYNDFIGWLDKTIAERKDIVESTKQVHRTLLDDIKHFRKSLLFADVDYGFLKQFDNYLKKNGNRINTRNKKFRALKSYLRIAEKDELINKNPFNDYQIESGPGRIVYLTREEVKALQKKYEAGQFNNSQAIAVRNWLFAFHACGMPRADFKRFVIDWVVSDMIIYTRHKTRRKERMIKIPLSRQAKKLIKEAAPNKVSGKVFRVFQDQTENRLLKEAATLCKINKSLTFHVARHTFATLFYEETGDIATLQKLLGHKNISETMVYAHISETKKQQLMKKFERLF